MKEKEEKTEEHEKKRKKKGRESVTPKARSPLVVKHKKEQKRTRQNYSHIGSSNRALD